VLADNIDVRRDRVVGAAVLRVVGPAPEADVVDREVALELKVVIDGGGGISPPARIAADTSDVSQAARGCRPA